MGVHFVPCAVVGAGDTLVNETDLELALQWSRQAKIKPKRIRNNFDRGTHYIFELIMNE